MKRLTSTIILFLAFTNNCAQDRIHSNMPLSLVGIVNVSFEKPLNDKFSVQSEVLVSPWKSFNGRNFQIYMISFEGKKYFLDYSKGFHFGGYVSMAKFNLQKGNINPNIGNEYHKGYAYVIGVSVGYYVPLYDRWGIDFFGGVGTVQTFYKAYYKVNDLRADPARNWNKSGEIVPTRGGISLIYNL